MLNIIKYKLKNSYKNLTNQVKYKKYWSKNYVPIIREWKNSIYTYNKNSLNNIFVANELINKLIKNYFNLYNKKLENKIRKNKSITWKIKNRNISKNKILISLGQFKHTSDLVDITIYFYNRQLLSYMYILSKKYLKILRKKNWLLEKKLFIIKRVGLKLIYREKEIKSLLLKNFNELKMSKINWATYKIFIRKSLKKEFFSIYYNMLIFINKSKFNNYYLYNLTNLVKKIFKKNIKFNFINLKYHYLNSDIFTQVLLLKLSTVKKRLLYALRRSIRKAKIVEENQENDIIQNSKYIKNLVLEDIKYKKLSGVRLEAAGRLTKRFTASRSLYKFKYKGNLINIKSSLGKESTAQIRGNFRPNVGHTKLHSKSRIGAFGLKGWISGI